jgi:hypothetical protein
MTTAPFGPGNYRYIPGVFQYSGGVAAEAGYRLERVMFRNPVPLKEGFARVEALIGAAVHRGRLPRLQRGLCRHAGEMGHLRYRSAHQSCRPLQCLPRDREAGRALVPRLRLHCSGSGRRALLPRRGQRRGARRQVQLSRSHHPSRRRLTRRSHRKGALRARRDGTPHGRARLHLGAIDGGAALYGARSASFSCRRGRPARRRPLRPHLALRAPAGRRARVRDGLPRHRGRACGLACCRRSLPPFSPRLRGKPKQGGSGPQKAIKGLAAASGPEPRVAAVAPACGRRCWAGWSSPVAGPPSTHRRCG